ncbi:hypothetical protein SH2C18_19030 [Clostridium sediminicola]|uniref:DUF3604 domain-containing protein n=1 Tax=Clostridium sediminicola TaxID=3114879 RepID=UPI0031F25B94
MSKKQLNFYGDIHVDSKSKIEVDGELEWVITYVAGAKGIKKGGSIKVILPAFQHQRSEEYVQVYDYWKSNFLYAYCEDENLKITTEANKIETNFSHIKRWPDSTRVALIIVEEEIKEGTKIFIHYGGISRAWMDRCAPPTRVGHNSHKKKGTFLNYKVFVDIEGNKEYKELNGFEPIEVIPGKEKIITTITPNLISVGERFEIKIFVKDKFNNPIFDYDTSDIEISIKDLKNNGVVINEGQVKNGIYLLELNEEGIFEVDVKVDDELFVEKSIILCKNSPYNIYWGDLHSHSNLTANIKDNNGGASPEDAYTYAKDVANIDFMGLSEQTFEFNEDKSLNITKEMWKLIGEKADINYKEGKFVAFPGFEFHSKRGDTVVLFSDSLSKFSYPEEWVKDIPDVWEYYGDKEYLTIPHLHRYCGGRKSKDDQDSKNNGFNYDNWEKNNENIERLGEIFSSQWGRFENENHPMLLKAKSNIPGNTIVDFLNKGRKWGITASSDDHDAMPGHGGVTAVYAKELTRKGVYEALYNRKSYASTHPRMIMYFNINESFMGEEVYYKGKTFTEPRRIKCTLAAPKQIKSVEIICNGEVMYSTKCDKQWTEIEFIDDSVISKDTYYYIRMKQIDEHMAWSSPIWFSSLN